MWRVGAKRGQCRCLASGGLSGTCPISSHFIHFLYATVTLLAIAVVVVHRVGGFAYVLGLSVPFKRILLRQWQFLPLPKPPLVFTARSYETLFPQCWNPGLCSWPGAEIPHSQGVPPDFYQLHVNWHCPYCCCHCPLSGTTPCPLCHGSLALPLLSVWMNMASLNPWLLDFHSLIFWQF